MQIVLWILLIAVLVIIVMNRASARRCDEDIDEIRSSLFDLRRQAKNRQAEMNRKLAELRVAVLKNHGMIPEDRTPFYITSDCISCGTCVTECPVNAITDGELFEIDPETCIACKKCADVCPVHACQPLLQQNGQS